MQDMPKGHGDGVAWWDHVFAVLEGLGWGYEWEAGGEEGGEAEGFADDCCLWRGYQFRRRC